MYQYSRRLLFNGCRPTSIIIYGSTELRFHGWHNIRIQEKPVYVKELDFATRSQISHTLSGEAGLTLLVVW